MTVVFVGGPLHGQVRDIGHAPYFSAMEYSPLSGAAEVRYTVRSLDEGLGQYSPWGRRWRVAVLDGTDPEPSFAMAVAVAAGFLDGMP